MHSHFILHFLSVVATTLLNLGHIPVNGIVIMKEASKQQKLYYLIHLAMESLKIFCFVSVTEMMWWSRAFVYGAVDVKKIGMNF